MSKIKDLWINLPVKDLNRAKRFFIDVGFKLNQDYNSDNAVSLSVGEKGTIVMLFPEDVFAKFSGNKIPNTKIATEVLFQLV